MCTGIYENRLLIFESAVIIIRRYLRNCFQRPLTFFRTKASYAGQLGRFESRSKLLRATTYTTAAARACPRIRINVLIYTEYQCRNDSSYPLRTACWRLTRKQIARLFGRMRHFSIRPQLSGPQRFERTGPLRYVIQYNTFHGTGCTHIYIYIYKNRSGFFFFCCKTATTDVTDTRRLSGGEVVCERRVGRPSGERGNATVVQYGRGRGGPAITEGRPFPSGGRDRRRPPRGVNVRDAPRRVRRPRPRHRTRNVRSRGRVAKRVPSRPHEFLRRVTYALCRGFYFFFFNDFLLPRTSP